MKIVSWSTVHGKSGTTANLLAVAMYSIIKGNIKNCIVTQTNFSMNNLEAPLVGYMMPEANLFQDIGLDALSRSIKAGPLNEKNFYNSSISLMDNKLNLLPGTTICSKEYYENDMEKVINNIILYAEKYYDAVYIDTNSGKNELSQKVIEKADLIIVNLPQNKKVLDNYFKEYIFNRRNVFFLIGNYDRRSKYNLNYIRKHYKMMDSSNSAVIPYCVEFNDALSDGSLIDFFSCNINTDKEDPISYFINNVGLATKRILKKAGWRGELV